MSTLRAFSTSHIQQANWFLYKLNPTGLSDKISIALRMQLPVDVPTVKNALQALTERHPILRSLYSEHNQEIIQEVRENVEIDFQDIDVSSWNNHQFNQELLKRAKSPFHLESGKVFRAFLLSRSATENILLLSVHQVAADWESLQILLEDFVTIYEAIIQGYHPDFIPLNVSYRDFIQNEIEFLESPKGKQVEDYWKQKLGNELPILELPTNSPRPALRTYNGKVEKFTIDSQDYQKIKKLAQTQAVTVEEILLATFKVLLYRYTGEEDLLVGLLQNREKRPQFKGVVGNLTNVTVTRDVISGDLKFTEFLTQVSKTLFKVQNYQDYPFSLLVKQLKLSNLSYPPICQAAFGYNNKQEQLLKSTLLDLEYYQLPQQKVDFELSLEITELEEYFRGDFKYNSDVLDTSTVTQITQHFHNLLTSILANPEITVDQLSILSPA